MPRIDRIPSSDYGRYQEAFRVMSSLSRKDKKAASEAAWLLQRVISKKTGKKAASEAARRLRAIPSDVRSETAAQTGRLYAGRPRADGKPPVPRTIRFVNGAWWVGKREWAIKKGPYATLAKAIEVCKSLGLKPSYPKTAPRPPRTIRLGADGYWVGGNVLRQRKGPYATLAKAIEVCKSLGLRPLYETTYQRKKMRPSSKN
jgi:hypothetical protein